MKKFNQSELKKLYISPKDSHKGQNGKLMIIGGSHLFHGASLWALKVASRIVDMVFYSSVPENNEIVKKAKEEFRDGIVVSRSQLESYIEEADCVLIGPGMVRTEEKLEPTEEYQIKTIKEIDRIENEGIQTYYLTKYLLSKYPQKKWVIDAGSLQMMEAEWLKQLGGNVIITPHRREFERLFEHVILSEAKDLDSSATPQNDIVSRVAKEHNCVILLKGAVDVVCSPKECVSIKGGNAGMTKGGTGDVLAGLVAALSCKNDLFLAATAGSFINKKAGDELFKRVGPYFNASDLANEIPRTMKKL
ncbi:MAG: NAD(P)H-hydrate dehydratase [bacterium]|nr:NAD(P)H-hydrate dehydratase [bacterium]